MPSLCWAWNALLPIGVELPDRRTTLMRIVADRKDTVLRIEIGDAAAVIEIEITGECRQYLLQFDSDECRFLIELTHIPSFDCFARTLDIGTPRHVKR